MQHVVADTYYVELSKLGRVLIRPVQDDDGPRFIEFLEHVTVEDLRLRFFGAVNLHDPQFIYKLTHPDSGCVAVCVAIDEKTNQVLGVARLHRIAGDNAAEYAVLVRSAIKGQGLGWELMQAIIRHARSAGLSSIEGYVLVENYRMLKMCGELGFRIEDASDPGVQIARLSL